MASPLIGALRRSFPEANIRWLAEEGAHPLLAAHPGLAEVIVWPRRRWKALLRKGRLLALAREAVPFVRRLRARKVDLALDAQGLLKSGLWAFLSGAPVRVGVGSREGSRHLMTRVVDRSRAGTGMSSQYRLLAEDLGLELGDFALEVRLPAEAERFAAALAEAFPSGYAAFAPFTTRPQKHWFEERWVELARRLGELGMPVVVLGGTGEREAGERMAAGTGGRNLAGATTLPQAAAVIAHARLLVGVDTGLTHAGIALRTPTVALFGPTLPYQDPGTPTARVLYHPHPCSPCRRRPICDGEFPCMGDLSVEEVLAASLGLLEPR
jgi:heptosyltransferase-1